jgi:uncharacterized protein (DUF305 family)
MSDNSDKKVTYAALGLGVGIIIALFFSAYAVNQHNNEMMHMLSTGSNSLSQNEMMDRHYDGMSSMMGDMSSMLKGKKGDDFDKAFLSQMIVHHQGAIDMANGALVNAKHQEIKDLARDIISAQEKEINQMKSWQDQWYK